MEIIYRFDPDQTRNIPRQGDAEVVSQALQAGNERFVSMLNELRKTVVGGAPTKPIVVPVCPISFGLPALPGSIPTQAPFAMVVGCADARVPIEIVFDQFFNGLFVVRVAGNALSTEGLGSIQYAVKTLSESLRVGLVLGHTGCGAMTAAVDSYLNPHDYAEIGFSHPLRSVLDRAMIAVRGADGALQTVLGRKRLSPARRRELLIELTVYLNAAITSFQLTQEVRQMGNQDLRVCYAVYDLMDGHVRSGPMGGGPPPKKRSSVFGIPPEATEGFVHLAQGWAERLLSRKSTGK
jgi:carbonic anhydrase